MLVKNKFGLILTLIMVMTIFVSGCGLKDSKNQTNQFSQTFVNGNNAEIKTESGTIEVISYKTNDIENNYKETIKNAEVYLPYGYKSSDTSVKYNILYFMHGTGGTESSYLGTPSAPSDFKKEIDKMIQNKEIEPLIIVMPTLRCGDDEDYVARSDDFNDELIDNLIPAVEQKYNTYTENCSKKGLKESRNHRAFGGFSMGSLVTWNIFISDIDYFKYYMPLSCTYENEKSREMSADDAAKIITDSIKKAGYTSSDYCIFSATGTKDEFGVPMEALIDSMKKYNDLFMYSETDFSKGNLIFYVADGYRHSMDSSCKYIFKGLPLMFK